MYQALYRKWRPKTFDEVIGQSHITDTLRRQVADGRTAHAYLFTGTRGTGKTTCARILAKAVNCLAPVDGAPCCECEACRSIDEGRALDVTELDAASNNGVDHVRALREEAVYTPSVLRKRVYIIDEVHMLSTAAFNALLKILEEPPEHLLFILATTELHKVPATILSRCQRFSFKRILPQDMERQLLAVAKTESISLTEDGAEILARMANGALRDALSLLDQCRAAEGPLDSAAILDVLGLAGGIQTMELMRHILARDTSAALTLFDRLYRGGKDIAATLGELSDLGRDLTIAKPAPKEGAALLSGLYDRKSLTELAETGSVNRFLYITSALQSCCASLPDSFHPRTDAELCLLRLCDESLSGDLSALSARIDRLEETLRNGAPAPLPGKSPVPKSPPSREVGRRGDELPPPEEPPHPRKPAGSEQVFKRPEEPEKAKRTPPEEEEKAPSPAASAAADTGIWDRLLNQYKGRLPVNHRAFLGMAKGVLREDVLTVFCGSDIVRDSLNNSAVLTVLREVTSAEAGREIRVSLAAGKPEDPPAEKAPPAETRSGQASPPSRDRLDELIRSGSQLDHFNIK